MYRKSVPPFEEVFQLYKQRIYNVVYHLVNNPHKAEDITQEVFIRAYKNYSNFRFESAVYSWLYRIALNLCREILRKEIIQRGNLGKEVSLDEVCPNQDGEGQLLQFKDNSIPTPLENLENKEVGIIIKEALGTIPPKYGDVFILKEIEGYSYEEISRLLDISISVVGIRLLRARNALRKKLKNIL